MKKFFISVAFCVSVFLSANATFFSGYEPARMPVSTFVGIGGIWGSTSQNTMGMFTKLSGTDFIIMLYDKTSEPWDYYCKVTIHDFQIPDLKTAKEVEKVGKQWWNFENCEMEYFYNIENPSLEQLFAEKGNFILKINDEGASKRTVKCKTSLSPSFFYLSKNFNSQAINFFIEDISYGISLGNVNYLLFHTYKDKK